jgi:hypothetical protein
MADTPFIAVGNDELGDALGDTTICPACGQPHPVEYGNRVLPDGTREPSTMLGFVKCDNGKTYLVGLAGRSIVR